MGDTIHGLCDITIVWPDGDRIVKGRKPYLRLWFPGGTVLQVTANIAEMIGGAGAGARLRYEDFTGDVGEGPRRV